MQREELGYFRGDAMAADVWRGKYALDTEKTPEDMHRRIAKEFAKAEYKNILTNEVNEKDLKLLSPFGREFFKTFYSLDKDNLQKFIEEVIFNIVNKFSGVVPQGSIMSQIGHPTQIGSLSNCFVIGQPYDSYGGIFQKDQECAQLMKRRGGVGLDISTLRPEDTTVLNSAGTSTGAVSFAERYSNTTREVAQKGRRGALMLSIDIRHPNSIDFINMKKDRTKVTGANISVLLRDDFMEAVKNDGDYILRFPCDLEIDKEYYDTYNFEYLALEKYGGGYTKRIKAKEYYDAIVENAWENAEPGQMFIDRHWDYSPDGVYKQYRGVTTNPCGEIFMQMYDACRLLALNFFTLVKNSFTDKAELDYELLYEFAYIQQWMADILIDLELEYINKIINKIKSDPEPEEVKATELRLWQNIYRTAASSRRTGSGFTALGDMLAALGKKYDSDDAMAIIAKVMKTKMKAELDCTIDLSVMRGSFKGWNTKLEFDENGGKNSFFTMLLTEFPNQVERMKIYGRRNVSWSTVAPTGSVSILTQTTSGLEPLFSPYYMRRKKINPDDKTTRVDFVDQNGDSWMEYPIVHPKFEEWYKLNCKEDDLGIELLTKDDLDNWFKISPWYGSVASDIDWLKRVQIQAIIQKYTTHSISSTINLPQDVTKEEVAKIYMYAHDTSLKGVTVYREGSRTGVLVKEGTENDNEFKQHDAPKRPKSLPCKVHQSTSKGKDWLIVVGMFKDKPYEVFCMENTWTLPKGILEADIVKLSRSKYRLEIKDSITIENIADGMTDEEAAITRLISTSLRHGADIKFVVEQLNKTIGDMQSFNKVIARTIKRYIPEGVETSGHTCDNCGADAIVYEEGCQKCKSCGSSKC